MRISLCVAGVRCVGLGPQWHALRNEITRLIQQQRQLPVPIFDEAHHLRNEVLEDLRLLTNFTMDSEPRLVIRHHFETLSRTETECYLQRRLLNAGAADQVQLFEANAIEMMHAQARGLRMICQV